MLRRPTRPRLAAFLIAGLATLLLLGGETVLATARERARLREAAGADLLRAAEDLSHLLDRSLGIFTNLLDLLGRVAEVLPEDDAAAARQVLVDAQDKAPSLVAIGLFDAARRPRAVAGEMPPPPPAGLAAPQLGPLRRGAAGPVLDLAVPTQDGGAVAAELEWSWADRIRRDSEQAEHRIGAVRLGLWRPDGEALPGTPQTLPGPLALPLPGWSMAPDAEGRRVIAAQVPGSGADLLGTPYWLIQARVQEAEALESLPVFVAGRGAAALFVALCVGLLASAAAGRAARAVREAAAAAERDPLTGLLNRAGLAAWQRARRAGEPLAVLALDLDRFKPVNDAHGHAVGDEVLAAVAAALAGAARREDAAVRLGGDEFLLVLPAGRAAAERAAERLLAALADGIPTSAGVMPVGTSIGLALVPEDAPDLAAAIAAADAALYAAKRAGRGRLARVGAEARG